MIDDPIRQPDANEIAYRRDIDVLRDRYPHRQYVAYFDGRIVGDSSSYDELSDWLDAQGMLEAMVVRVGDEPPESTEILGLSLHLLEDSFVTITDELNENDLAYRRDYLDLHQRYPDQQYVAYYEGKIVSDSDDFDRLLANLKHTGINPKTAMVVRVGDELIEYMDILCNEFIHE